VLGRTRLIESVFKAMAFFLEHFKLEFLTCCHVSNYCHILIQLVFLSLIYYFNSITAMSEAFKSLDQGYNETQYSGYYHLELPSLTDVDQLRRLLLVLLGFFIVNLIN